MAECGSRMSARRGHMGGRAFFASSLAVACITGALLVGAAAEARATRDRPPPGYTGGFGEAACNECHFAAPLDSGDGALRIDGIPDAYDPGAIYPLTITLTQPGLGVAGFELSARFDDGTQAGALARCAADSLRIDISTLKDVHYIHHTYDGALPAAPDTARWTVLWTAPDAGAVQFHAAANAADDDASPLGDFIYAVSARSSPRR